MLSFGEGGDGGGIGGMGTRTEGWSGWTCRELPKGASGRPCPAGGEGLAWGASESLRWRVLCTDWNLGFAGKM